MTPAQSAGGNPTDARRAAAAILDHILVDGEPFELAWSGENHRLSKFSRRDRGFARLLVTTALRHLGEIDHLLDRLMRRPLPDKVSVVRQIMRLGVTQLRFLKTPPHAAIDQAVRLTRQCGHAGLAGLVNAVLRKIVGQPAISADEAASLNTPRWLIDSWRHAHGDANAMAICRAHMIEPPLDLTVPDDGPRWASTLGGALLPTGSVRLAQAGEVAALAGYGEGAWWVQDAAAALPARLLAPKPGATVLDLCAAPGGKTAQLAAMGARVTAVDQDRRRATLLRENLQRLSLTARIEVADAGAFAPDRPAEFILLDAPCTATGTLRRHPDIAQLKGADDVARMATVQARLLTHAASLLAPGGILVYAVCSLQPEEGPDQIAMLLARDGAMERVAVSPEEVPGLAHAITADGDVATLPSMWPEHGHLDGFFIARLTRKQPTG